MSTERRPGFPNGDPEDYREKGRLEELRKQDLSDYKRRFRPVRLFVTSPERGPCQSLEQKIGLSNFGLQTQHIKSLIPPDWDQLGV